MDEKAFERLQRIAQEAALRSKPGDFQVTEQHPSADIMETFHKAVAACTDQGKVMQRLGLDLQAADRASREVVAQHTGANRTQRRRKRKEPGPKRSSKDPEVHAFANSVRRMSDKQIWNLVHPNDQR